MRYLTIRSVSRWLALITFLTSAVWSADDKIKIGAASISPRTRLVEVTISPDQKTFDAAVKSLSNPSSWQVNYRGASITITEASVNPIRGSVTLHYPPGQVSESSEFDIPKDTVDVTYLPDKANAKVLTGPPATPPVVKWHGFLSGCTSFGFTDEKDKADIDLTGAFQAGVNAKPQYNWSAKAKCSMLGTARKTHGELDLSFTGEASQQNNADPDSMKAGVKWIRRVNFSKSRRGFLFDVDALSYEFERKVKDEAVLKDGNPALRKYLDKNSNLIWGGLARYNFGWKPLSLTLGFVGFEGGAAVSRTIKADSRSGGPWPVARLHFDGDAYRYLYKGTRTVLTIHAHHTLRLPFKQEPYTRITENGGDMYLTNKPRNWTLLELGIPLADGANISIQYKRGTLPPSFEFVNHQLTVGFNLLLAKH